MCTSRIIDYFKHLSVFNRFLVDKNTFSKNASDFLRQSFFYLRLLLVCINIYALQN